MKKLEMVIYTDSDWAGDKDNRHSVTGYIMYLMNFPILWKSRLQKIVDLSSTEAEYYALSEAAKEIKFLLQVMESIGIEVELPVIDNVNNVGATFLAENASARNHFVCEYVEDGAIRLYFFVQV
jgi:hypothetical protein